MRKREGEGGKKGERVKDRYRKREREEENNADAKQK